MVNEIAEYYRRITALIGSVSVTGRKSEELGVSEGISGVCAMIRECGEAGKKVIFIGNGGSAAIASHMSIDFWKNGGIKATSFNDGSLLTCLGNDYGYQHVFEKPVEVFSEEGDILFAISSSGKSENILNGSRAARRKGCKIVTCSGFGPDNPLRASGDYNFYVPSMEYGPVEVIHQLICHSILDILLAARKKAAQA